MKSETLKHDVTVLLWLDQPKLAAQYRRMAVALDFVSNEWGSIHPEIRAHCKRVLKRFEEGE